MRIIIITSAVLVFAAAGTVHCRASEMNCMHTAILSITLPRDTTLWMGHGSMEFTDGRSAVLFSPQNIPQTNYSGSWKPMRPGDHVVICISVKPKRCPPSQGHHAITVQDLDRSSKFESTTGGSSMAYPCEMPLPSSTKRGLV